ncbi:FAD-binding protein [Nonomuraea dietziae]|uniref:FAD-binding protein n=1 Tax=Nonomuraea dietziae TaxID=65515 RepID=UPI0031D35793
MTSRSGGHSYAGWSTGSGLVVDVSRMNTVTYRAGRATVGAGAKLIDVYDKLIANGVSVPAGTCPTVGIARPHPRRRARRGVQKYGLDLRRPGVRAHRHRADGRVLTL